MRPLLPLVLLIALPTACPAGDAHLFLLSGQSNMALLDVDSLFTPVVAAALAPAPVVVVRDAEGNRPIRCWWRGAAALPDDPPGWVGHLHDRLLARLAAVADPDTFATVTFVWMQGERDACRGRGAGYAAALAGLFRQLRSELDRPDMGVVLGRINDHGRVEPRCTDWDLVRAAQVAVCAADPRCAWIDTDDLNDGPDAAGRVLHDAMHCSAAGYAELGRRLARAAAAMATGGR